MKTELEAVLRVIYERAMHNPKTARVHADDVDSHDLAILIESHHLKWNLDGTVTLTPAGLVVARRPRRAEDPAPDEGSEL